MRLYLKDSICDDFNQLYKYLFGGILLPSTVFYKVLGRGEQSRPGGEKKVISIKGTFLIRRKIQIA